MRIAACIWRGSGGKHGVLDIGKDQELGQKDEAKEERRSKGGWGKSSAAGIGGGGIGTCGVGAAAIAGVTVMVCVAAWH